MKEVVKEVIVEKVVEHYVDRIVEVIREPELNELEVQPVVSEFTQVVEKSPYLIKPHTPPHLKEQLESLKNQLLLYTSGNSRGD